MAATVPWKYLVVGIFIVSVVCGLDQTCEDGKYGYECKFTCTCQDSNEVCDKVTGHCPSSRCAKGKWGPGCSLEKKCFYALDKERGLNYQGRMKKSKDGHRCLFWTSRGAQRRYKYSDASFPDDSISDARNFCRSPKDNDRPREPWCYISENYPYFGYCDVTNCDCPNGRFGLNCARFCHCRDGRGCDKETGSCPNGACHEDWEGPYCQKVKVQITKFYNDKVNPGTTLTSLTCVITADPRPRADDISLANTRSARISYARVEVKEVGQYSMSKTWIGAAIGAGDEYTCTYGVDPSISKTIEVQFFELPRLKYAPFAGSRESRQLVLQWKKWTQGVDSGDPPILEYVLHQGKKGELARIKHNACIDQFCSYRITGLRPAQEYYFQVVAVRVGPHGTGHTSPLATVQTRCDVPSKGPIDMKHQGMDKRGHWIKMKFVWQLPDRSQYNCRNVIQVQFFLYKLDRSSQPVLVQQKLLSAGQRSYTEYRLEPYKQYEAFTRYKTESFWSPNSTQLQFQTMESTPSAPVNIAVTMANSSALEVAWNEPLETRGEITLYSVRVLRLGGHMQKSCFLKRPFGQTKRCLVKGLVAFANYTIQVKAKTNAGWGDESVIAYGFTEEGLPGRPESLLNVSRTSTSVALKWTAPFTTNGNLLEYLVQCAHMPSLDVVEKIVRPDVTQLNMTSLQSGSKYVCTVKAKTGKGYGKPARVITATLPLRPEKPTTPKLLLEESTETTFTLKLAPVKGCKIYRIVIHKLSEEARYNIDRRRRDTLNEDDLQRKKNPHFYTAAELTEADLAKPFVVGDGKMYGGYQNVPLVKGNKYDVYFGAGNSNGEVSYFSYTKMSQPVRALQYVAPTKMPIVVPGEVEQGDPTGAIVGAVVVVVLMVVIAGVVAGMLYRRKRRQNLDISKPGDEDGLAEKHALTGGKDDGGEDSDTEDETTNLCTTVDNEPLYTNMGEIRHSVPIDELEEYISDMKMNKNDKFKHEYQQIPWGLTAPCEVAKKSENRHKNRYGNIVAYDHSRVILDQLEGVPDSDYINADYMDGYTNLKAYIATQGPSKQTAADLWRMAWQENATKIVMVTNLVEDGRRKCEMYWPEEGSKEYGAIEVRLVAIERRADFIIRTFEMAKDNQKRPIKQYHFTAWPDHGAPSHATPLLGFWRKVRSYEVPDSGPMICHCSAGVGRTGTFIALDYLMDQADTEGKVNVYAYVKDMRTKRCNMIQTLEQYVFLHNALLEAIKSGNTCIPAEEFILEHATLSVLNTDTKKTPMEEQFELLRDLILPINMSRVKSALDTENSSKNRDPTIVPYNSCRPYLITPVDGSTDYINAVFIDSYRNKDEFIVTQAPLPNTVIDFWRMVYDHKSSAIVMVNEANDADESMVQYWPEEGSEVTTYGPFTVELVAPAISNSTVTMREFKITYSRRLTEEPLIVKQFQLNCWPDVDDTPESPSILLDLMTTVFQASQTGPITVHCRNGAEHSGLFVAACYVVEKLSLEREVDVFQAVKHICINRPHLVASFEQYKFCYQLIQAYLDKNQPEPIYGNVNC